MSTWPIVGFGDVACSSFVPLDPSKGPAERLEDDLPRLRSHLFSLSAPRPRPRPRSLRPFQGPQHPRGGHHGSHAALSGEDTRHATRGADVGGRCATDGRPVRSLRRV